MKRFALLLEEGLGDAAALARARAECRAAFERGGTVEQEIRNTSPSRVVTDGGIRFGEELLEFLGMAGDRGSMMVILDEAGAVEGRAGRG